MVHPPEDFPRDRKWGPAALLQGSQCIGMEKYSKKYSEKYIPLGGQNIPADLREVAAWIDRPVAASLPRV
jgi:hypothetical protein